MFNWKRVIDKVTVTQIDPTLYGIESWFASEAVMSALEAGEVIYSRDRCGFLKCSTDELVNLIGTDFKKVYDGGVDKKIYANDISLLVVEDEGEDNINICLVTTNEDVAESFDKVTKEMLNKTRDNTVSVLTSSMDGFYLTPIGTLDAPFEKDNYDERVVDDFSFVAKDLKSSDPFGRLVIVNGAPGTGKTFLIRGLINELAGNTIVLIPPKMISEIDGPSLLPTFISHKKQNKRPITLIIEDADACLAPRASDNISSISSLLNYTDGILGSLLDLKIIATTNQDKLDFDSALTRSGRLSRHIEVGELSSDKASEIYKRLTGEEKAYNKDTVLADVYMDAKVTKVSEIIDGDGSNNDEGNQKSARKFKNKIRKRLGFS